MPAIPRGSSRNVAHGLCDGHELVGRIARHSGSSGSPRDSGGRAYVIRARPKKNPKLECRCETWYLSRGSGTKNVVLLFSTGCKKILKFLGGDAEFDADSNGILGEV